MRHVPEVSPRPPVEVVVLGAPAPVQVGEAVDPLEVGWSDRDGAGKRVVVRVRPGGEVGPAPVGGQEEGLQQKKRELKMFRH